MSFVCRPSQSHWYATVSDPKFCAGGESNTKCVLHFAVCEALPSTVCNNGNTTGFCQVVTDGNIEKQYDTGKFSLIIHDAGKSICQLIFV